MSFQCRNGWNCQFLEQDLKIPLPRKLHFATSNKVVTRSYAPTGTSQGRCLFVGFFRKGCQEFRRSACRVPISHLVCLIEYMAASAALRRASLVAPSSG